ncbi:hypothetical protein SPHINGOT1_620037 [Sphingomonas sp. T1]|nr:hypothetical protein SPHINGOT1_620037 [Sphingomonas sp. T1]
MFFHHTFGKPRRQKVVFNGMAIILAYNHYGKANIRDRKG